MTSRSPEGDLLGNLPWLDGARLDQDELLDLGYGSASDVVQNLAEMERTNRYLGGYSALTRHLLPRLAAVKHPVRVVDIGTGAGGLPRLIVEWARRGGLNLSVLAIDWSPRNLAVAALAAGRYSEIRCVQADAKRLPLPRSGADYVTSSLVLHHFAPEALSRLLRESYEVSRCGLVMTDLVRGWVPYFAFKLVQPVFARNFLTRADGATSIRRAYRPAELLAQAHAAGLHHACVYTHWPWRMTITVDR
jgi:ubiquinone/menaquinone biosynthesis C-methylase UbiE